MAVPLQLAIPLVGAGAILAAAWLDARLKSRKPDLVYAPTEFNEAVLANCPTLLRFVFLVVGFALCAPPPPPRRHHARARPSAGRRRSAGCSG